MKREKTKKENIRLLFLVLDLGKLIGWMVDRSLYSLYAVLCLEVFKHLFLI